MKKESLILIEETLSHGVNRTTICKDCGIGVKTLNRWKTYVKDMRNGPNSSPANKLKTDEIDEIIKISTSTEYVDKTPNEIVPLLADKGIYIASESSFYRVLKENKLMAHRGKTKPKTHKKPEPLVATAPNQIYSWDITYLKSPVLGMFYYLYMFMDIYSRKIVGFKVHETESMECSASLIAEICRKENITKDQLILHADNGGAMKGATMLATLQRLGVVPSFSRPRVSDDNPYSESLFKTLKYCPEYPSRAFRSIDEASDWVKQFVNWYNNEHLHSGIKFITPNARHSNEDDYILNRRKIVYEEARLRNKNRWSGKIRNWNKTEKVYLNYLQKEIKADKISA
jgi:transposase InsO family protein